ncbi:unnamed protein product [Linum tenue]|uniref:Uncharacterized protein n=1 Tax=Linum tenue TaxID=586396 RepID=A0AAV0MIG0_9ROSI|nr:unnamed protein product [Linum tenue]
MAPQLSEQCTIYNGVTRGLTVFIVSSVSRDGGSILGHPVIAKDPNRPTNRESGSWAGVGVLRLYYENFLGDGGSLCPSSALRVCVWA